LGNVYLHNQSAKPNFFYNRVEQRWVVELVIFNWKSLVHSPTTQPTLFHFDVAGWRSAQGV